ncbi:MAG: hypothetical protein GEV10_02785 [Streptosporangiales bacterium]|nr:hypothetical protein [Streptosporangiales bacterium]
MVPRLRARSHTTSTATDGANIIAPAVGASIGEEMPSPDSHSGRAMSHAPPNATDRKTGRLAFFTSPTPFDVVCTPSSLRGTTTAG